MEGVKNFTNIDDKDFVGMYGGDEATVKAGKTVAFTEIIANHLAGQLAAKMLIAQGKPWTDKGSKGERAQLIAQIFGGDATGVKKDGTVGIIEPMEAIKTPKASKGKTVDADETPDTSEDKKKKGEEEFEDLPKDEDEAPTKKPVDDNLESKSFKKLRELAKKKGLDLKKIGTSKAKLIRALSK